MKFFVFHVLTLALAACPDHVQDGALQQNLEKNRKKITL
jgi:hypothetical protein